MRAKLRDEIASILTDIESAATMYATALAEAAFLAGLAAGGDLRSLICK